MIGESRTDTPRVVQRLGVALQFVDAFSGELIRAPLRVTIPARELVAITNQTDASYRFLMPEPPFPLPPPAPEIVVVEAADGTYVSHEAISVQLPRIPSGPVPPVKRSDYLIRATLWPTTRVRTPAGETAVIGHVEAGAPPVAAVGYKVVLHTAAENPNLMPYARTDANGDFLVRLGRFKASAPSSGPAVKTVTLSVKLFTPGGVAVAGVTPNTVTLNLGSVRAQQFIAP